MKSNKYLEFNGKNIFFLAVDGTYWIAVKPICEALGVNYNRQFQNLKKDKILGSAFAVQQMQVDNDQTRNWACLPEFFIYGWIFKLRSDSEKLEEYQWKIYEILYNYFRGALTQREELLKVKTQTDFEIEKLEKKLKESSDYLKLIELKDKKKKASSSLNKLDKDIIDTQLDIWKQTV